MNWRWVTALLLVAALIAAPLMHEQLGTVEQGAVRFSFCYFTTEEEVEKAILAVKEIAEAWT